MNYNSLYRCIYPLVGKLFTFFNERVTVVLDKSYRYYDFEFKSDVKLDHSKDAKHIFNSQTRSL